MLWIHINNTGSIDCYVNVGNKIRQGNPFDAFVVVDGDYADGAENPPIWSLSNVTYIKPTSDSFVHNGVTLDGQFSDLTFQLGQPSQANSYFIGGQTYHGKVVHFDSNTTKFDGNGGHMAILFTMQRNDGNVELAETLSIFLEPTYGNKNTPLNLNDYNELIQLYRKSATINLGVLDSLDELDDILYTDTTLDDDGQIPYSFYAFTYDQDPYFLFVGFDEDLDCTIQQMMRLSMQNGLVEYSQRKNPSGVWTEWEQVWQDSVLNISQARSEDANGLWKTMVTITTKGGITQTFTIYDGVGIREIQTNYVDEGAGYNEVTFKLTDGTQKQIRVSNGADGNGIRSINVIPNTEDGGINRVVITQDNGETNTLNVKNGSKGSPALGNVGLIFMVVSNDPSSPYYYLTLGLDSSLVGHLVLNYQDGSTPPNIKLVSDDPNSDSYYETLGVPASMVGHLLYFND